MSSHPYITHNWLIHKINQQVVARNVSAIRGIVMDLGCGNAPYKEYILKHADAYIGVDWQNSLHDNANVNIAADLSMFLPFCSESIDTVTLFQVLEHLPEPQQILDEASRLLKPGGYLLIVVPFMWQVHEAPYDYYRYTRFGLEYMLRKSGFKIIEITENTGFWQMFILKFNYYTTKFSRGIFCPLLPLWIIIWWLDQIAAQWLDRIDWYPGETVSYTVRALK